MLQGHNNALTHCIILSVWGCHYNLTHLATLTADTLCMATSTSALGFYRNDDPTPFNALNNTLMLQRRLHRLIAVVVNQWHKPLVTKGAW